ncbi:MAG: hypothetical protein ABI988_15905 [Nitrospirota bacterium]
MWFADIFCDVAWVRERNGVLGPARFSLRGAKSQSLGIEIDLQLFGDDLAVRHARTLMHTDEQGVAERCLDLNVQIWVASPEVAVMLTTNRPFQVLRVNNSQTFAIGLGQGHEQSPALVIDISPSVAQVVQYQQVALGMSAWGGDLSQYLFYFRRLVDGALPLDVRWLNGYRLLEWHFVREDANLGKSQAWRQFVGRFDSDLLPLCRTKQKPVGLLEKARALAAHAGLDNRSDSERAADPRNAMETTLRVLESMVIVVLNEHPSRSGHPVQWRGSSDAQQPKESSA